MELERYKKNGCFIPNIIELLRTVYRALKLKGWLLPHRHSTTSILNIAQLNKQLDYKRRELVLTFKLTKSNKLKNKIIEGITNQSVL